MYQTPEKPIKINKNCVWHKTIMIKTFPFAHKLNKDTIHRGDAFQWMSQIPIYQVDEWNRIPN